MVLSMYLSLSPPSAGTHQPHKSKVKAQSRLVVKWIDFFVYTGAEPTRGRRSQYAKQPLIDKENGSYRSVEEFARQEILPLLSAEIPVHMLLKQRYMLEVGMYGPQSGSTVRLQQPCINLQDPSSIRCFGICAALCLLRPACGAALPWSLCVSLTRQCLLVNACGFSSCAYKLYLWLFVLTVPPSQPPYCSTENLGQW